MADVVVVIVLVVAGIIILHFAETSGQTQPRRKRAPCVRVITQEYPDVTHANYSADIRGDAAASDWTAEVPLHIISEVEQHVFRACTPRELAERIRRAGDTRGTVGWVVEWADDIHHAHEQDVRPARKGDDVQPW